MFKLIKMLFGKKQPVTAPDPNAPPAPPAVKKPLIAPAPFAFEGIDAIQVISAVVNVVLGILTVLGVLDPLIFWATYTIGLMVSLGLLFVEWRSMAWEGLIYVLGLVPIIMFILGMTVLFKAVGAYAVMAGLAELALIALYQWPIAKWLEK